MRLGGPLLGWLSLVALVLVPLGAKSLQVGAAGSSIALLVAVVAIRVGDWPTMRVTTMTVLLAAIGGFGIPFSIWWVVGVMWLAGRRLPKLVPELGWLPGGSSSRGVWWLTGVTVVGSGVALALWARWTNQFAESTVEIVDAIRRWPLALVVPAIAAFVIVNAVAEEIAYRGIVQGASSAFFPPIAAVVAQAAAFGALHIVGFPAGSIGVGLAFVYGLTLGVLRHLTGGLRYPIIAHMAADTTIAILALALVRPT